MSYPLTPPIQPMLARAAADIPQGEWRYEPKWDGFRAIVYRDSDRIHIGSRNALPLERYFPELLDPLLTALPDRCVVDGEIVIATSQGLDFDALQMRLHPAESRVRMLAARTPASTVLFDILALGDDDLRPRPLAERRALLCDSIAADRVVGITPQTDSAERATDWFTQYEGAGLDGVVAKQPAQPYLPGERGWIKVKHLRTVDCVVGGFREGKGGPASLGSLLLGLYQDGVLHHVGHTSSFSAAERREVRRQLEPLVGGESFVFSQGRTPGGPSRWARDMDLTWVSVKPELVCEVSFDHLQGRRFRHASRFIRWRPDKSPTDCTFEQLAPPEHFALEDIVVTGR
ncbi:MAG: ATP-dependent DNA ligase [Candidatus Dormibacteraeota bacterium]|nr:ATP-dependent DNA ligase [Candidatus Dormibacteraeota bacterium]